MSKRCSTSWIRQPITPRASPGPGMPGLAALRSGSENTLKWPARSTRRCTASGEGALTPGSCAGCGGTVAAPPGALERCSVLGWLFMSPLLSTVRASIFAPAVIEPQVRRSHDQIADGILEALDVVGGPLGMEQLARLPVLVDEVFDRLPGGFRLRRLVEGEDVAAGQPSRRPRERVGILQEPPFLLPVDLEDHDGRERNPRLEPVEHLQDLGAQISLLMVRSTVLRPRSRESPAPGGDLPADPMRAALLHEVRSRPDENRLEVPDVLLRPLRVLLRDQRARRHVQHELGQRRPLQPLAVIAHGVPDVFRLASDRRLPGEEPDRHPALAGPEGLPVEIHLSFAERPARRLRQELLDEHVLLHDHLPAFAADAAAPEKPEDL